MELRFSGEIWYWRGPSPFHFVTVPDQQSAEIESASRLVTYGWGMIPATVQLGKTEWKTALWPKDGGYIVPIKTEIRRQNELDVDDTVELVIRIDA